jgi:hypothetical protein
MRHNMAHALSPLGDKSSVLDANEKTLYVEDPKKYRIQLISFEGRRARDGGVAGVGGFSCVLS